MAARAPGGSTGRRCASLIIQVPKGPGLHISLSSDVVHQNDSQSRPFPCVVLYVTSQKVNLR